MKRGHFFDIDTILTTNNMVWIIDKTIPNIPIMKISKPDFNLIKSGLYKSQNNSIIFGDDVYWIPTDLYEEIKIKAKNYKADISNLAFSMQEFMNKSIIKNLDYDLNLDNILHLKNTDDDIYIVCSKNTQTNYELMISKIEDKLKENGLIIKKFYHLSETFYNRNSDDISYKKVRLILQHLIGYKTEINKFTNESLEQYDEICFYDDDNTSIKLAINANKILMGILSNTDSDMKNVIKDELKSKNHTLIINEVTPNKVNRFRTTKVDIKFNNLITVFESFNNFKIK